MKDKKFIEYYEYFKDKYLVLQEVRNQENFYFNQMKAWQKNWMKVVMKIWKTDFGIS